MSARWAVAVGLVFVLGALMPGCGGGDDQSTSEGGGQETTEALPQREQGSPPDGEELKSIRLTLEGYPDAENLGILMADQRGYFTDAGLDVEVLSPVVSDNVAEYVASGLDEIGLLPQPELVLARGKGIPLVAIGSLVQRPTMAMIWLGKSKIDGIADLAGKTIAIDGLPVEEGLIETVLAQAGLTLDDVRIKRLGFLRVPALVKGRADVLFGSRNVEGVELEARGLELVVTPVQELGIPSYEELVVITRRGLLSRRPRWIHAFMSAVARGTAAAIADPEAAAEAIATARKEIGYGEPGKPALRRAKVEATLPLLSRSVRMSPERAAGLVGWMHDQGLIQRRLPPAALLTNRFSGP